jgi:hypothetical protein
LQQFRIQTLLIFHHPVTKRARHAAKRHHPGEAGVGERSRGRRAKPGSASEAGVGERSRGRRAKLAPGAEREGFSLLGFSRDCRKFSSADFSLSQFITGLWEIQKCGIFTS